MRLLIIAPYLPMADRGSEELRFSAMLGILAPSHDVTLYVWSRWGQEVSPADQKRYESAVTELGIKLRVGFLNRVLKETAYDVVMVEWFHNMEIVWKSVRAWQPQARIVVDTVELEYRQLTYKAAVSESPADRGKAAETKRRELAAYRRADYLITISEEERAILLAEDLGVKIAALPNIHAFEESLPELTEEPIMSFVGDYRVAHNVDAVVYFCREVLPLIHQRVPAAKFLVVGNAPTDEVTGLASDRVVVTGYVSEVKPYLLSSRVSVAPLRYGSGMKGKVGEAMALGIPVVSTTVGVQGMNVTHEVEVLVGDCPQVFADSVVRLFGDWSLCESLRRSAWQSLRAEVGEQAAKRRLNALLADALADTGSRARVSPLSRWHYRSVDWLERNLLWRFERRSAQRP